MNICRLQKDLTRDNRLYDTPKEVIITSITDDTNVELRQYQSELS